MNINLPLGARLAAEHTYANMSCEQRRNPARVAEALLTAAAPFMTPVLAELGRGRITPTGAKDIFRYWLRGEKRSQLAGRFAVTQQTINKYIQRGLLRTRTRLAAGIPIGTIAGENQITSEALQAVLDLEEARRARPQGSRSSSTPGKPVVFDLEEVRRVA